MPTKIELTLEQLQQGVSNDVLVGIEGVEELKRNVWIKGENNAALHYTLRQKPGGSQLQPPITKTKSAQINVRRSYALSWKPCQGDSLNLPDHRYKVSVAASFQRSRIHKPHAHTQAFKVNPSTTRPLIL
nr:hypothetical protein [Tanacetum cinerariifolium]